MEVVAAVEVRDSTGDEKLYMMECYLLFTYKV